MYALWIIAFVVAVFGAIFASRDNMLASDSQLDTTVQQANAYANNAMVYQAAVMAYVSANPTFGGTVPLASLTTLPDWYPRNNAHFTNQVLAGNIVIYPDPANPLPLPISGALFQASAGSIGVGVTKANVIQNPGMGSTGINIQTLTKLDLPDNTPVLYVSIH